VVSGAAGSRARSRHVLLDGALAPAAIIVLAATLLVAAGFGLRIAQRSVETEVRDRTVELARAATAALRRAGTDDEQISEELAATIRMHRGLLRAELARPAALGLDSDFVSARVTPEGITLTRWRGPLPSLPRASAIVDEPEQGRALRDRVEQIRIRWGARP